MRGLKHFFPKPIACGEGLSIRGIGVQEQMPNVVINRPRGTGDYLLMLFHDPVWVGGAESPLRQAAPCLMIWPPDQRQYYGNETQPFKHSWMHCNGTQVAALLESAGLVPGQPVLLANPAVFDRGLMDLHEELTGGVVLDPIIVRNLVENLLRGAARARQRLREAAAPEVPPAFLELRNQMELHCERRYSLASLAAKVNLSVPRFCACFRIHFHCSAMEFLIRARMQNAAFLLRDCNLKVAAVAAQVGYDDLQHFSKAFKKQFGIGPREMRRELQGR